VPLLHGIGSRLERENIPKKEEKKGLALK